MVIQQVVTVIQVKKIDLKKFALERIIMFVVGFCLYITIEVCFRGYSFVSMGICGGCIFIILDSINDLISWDMDLLLQGIIGFLLSLLLVW